MQVSRKTKRSRSGWTYVAEFNRIIHDRIYAGARVLKRTGIDVDILTAHKTLLMLKRPSTMTWDEFKDAIRSVIQPRRGSVVIFSAATGNTYICSNRGNQPGDFVRQ